MGFKPKGFSTDLKKYILGINVENHKVLTQMFEVK